MNKAVFSVFVLCAIAVMPLPVSARFAGPGAVSTQAAAEKPPAEKIFQQVVNATLILRRSQEDISADLEAARQQETTADHKVSAAQEEMDWVSGLLQQQKEEVAALKKKIDQVKKNRQQIDRITLEAEKKRADKIQEFLEKYKSLAEATFDGARSERDLAQARSAAFQAELELSQKREARDKAADSELASAGAAVSLAQDKALRLFKTAADKNKSTADKLSNIESKRMDLFEVRSQLVTGSR